MEVEIDFGRKANFMPRVGVTDGKYIRIIKP
jgi:hypothetical protein